MSRSYLADILSFCWMVRLTIRMNYGIDPSRQRSNYLISLFRFALRCFTVVHAKKLSCSRCILAETIIVLN